MQNFLNNLPRNGDKVRNVDPNELTFSSNDITDKTLPKTLGDLRKIVPDKYITYSVYANANGSVSKHDCEQYNFLTILGYTGTSVDGTVYVARTDYAANSGGDITLFGGNAYYYDNDPWYKLYTGPKLLDKITSGNRDQPGPGRTCTFYDYGGWSAAKVSVLFFVTVDVQSYCTESDNIGNDFCFAMMGDYYKDTSRKMGQATATYVSEYCARNIPNGDLSTASAKNQQICACNMPEGSYDHYNVGRNVTGIRKVCYLNDCLRSPFKPANLNDCPAPNCLNLVAIDNSPVTGGGNLNINQGSECLNILNGSDNNGDNNGDINPTPTSTQQSFFEKNKTIIIIIIVIIVLIIIAATFYFVASD